jgi:hypothetical protein
MESNPLEKAVRDIQDTLVVMAHMEKRQSEHLSDLLEFRVLAETRLARGEKAIERAEIAIAEIADKLNGLIGYIDNQKRSQS